jgi:hypothetical protein
MSDSANDHQCLEGMEYALAGGWLSVVPPLVRWLTVAGCYEHTLLLSREVEALLNMPMPNVEATGLKAIFHCLGHLYNDPPKQLTQEQLKELKSLRMRASRFVQYRIRQLASERAVTERATRNLVARDAAISAKRLEGLRVNSIRRSGGVWKIHFGEEQGSFSVSDFGAIKALVKLVSVPSRPVSLDDLVDPRTRPLIRPQNPGDDVLDNPAMQALKDRYKELQEDRAKEDDPLVQEENEEEQLRILGEVKKNRGPSGRKRKLGTTLRKQAWDALTRNLRRLWPRFEDNQMPELAAHLQNACQFDCPNITYIPPSGTDPWAVDLGI